MERLSLKANQKLRVPVATNAYTSVSTYGLFGLRPSFPLLWCSSLLLLKGAAKNNFFDRVCPDAIITWFTYVVDVICQPE